MMKLIYMLIISQFINGVVIDMYIIPILENIHFLIMSLGSYITDIKTCEAVATSVVNTADFTLKGILKETAQGTAKELASDQEFTNMVVSEVSKTVTDPVVILPLAIASFTFYCIIPCAIDLINSYHIYGIILSCL
jgi:hypothetical protein